MSVYFYIEVLTCKLGGGYISDQRFSLSHKLVFMFSVTVEIILSIIRLPRVSLKKK